jgi:cytochrome c peroxidase
MKTAHVALAACVAGLAALAACSSDPPSPASADAGGSPRSDAGGDAAAPDASAPFAWDFPPDFPPPKVPADNPMSAVKVELGRRLFFDKRLSGNLTQSCASCHDPAKAFADDRARGKGSTGEEHSRGAMSLANVGYMSALTWANPLMLTLEQQALVPMFGDNPVELGLKDYEQLLSRLRPDPAYADLFARAFPGAADPITIENVTKAIACFERTILSGRSAYDRYLAGDKGALTESQKRGREMFFSERFECYHCHAGFLFSDSTTTGLSKFYEVFFHNTGLYNVDGKGAYPEPNRGVMEVTGKPSDMGRFRVPTLRNVAVTAPYFHDGSAATLSDVLDHYAAGGRTIASGPYAGDGSKSPLKSDLVRGFALDTQEKLDLVAFLQSLTDDVFLKDPKLQDPFPK